MNLIFVINTILGYSIALVYDILRRNKNSQNSPKKFNLGFFLRDNKVRLIFSLILSLLVMYSLHLNAEDAGSLVGKDWTDLNSLIYFVVGAAPDLVISYFKRKVEFLQPENTDGFKRK